VAVVGRLVVETVGWKEGRKGRDSKRNDGRGERRAKSGYLKGKRERVESWTDEGGAYTPKTKRETPSQFVSGTNPSGPSPGGTHRWLLSAAGTGRRQPTGAGRHRRNSTGRVGAAKKEGKKQACNHCNGK
jgi:hypothetical protein